MPGVAPPSQKRLAEWSAPDTAKDPEYLVGQVLPAEGAWLRAAARRVPGYQTIVELGSYTGKSTACLAVGSAEGNSAQVFAIDLWTSGTSRKGREFHAYDPATDGDRRGSSKFHHQGALEKFARRMDQYDRAHVVLPLVSETVLAAEHYANRDPKSWVGLLFIDAEHTYEAVSADFAAWSPLVAPDGTIAMHDYAGKPPEDRGVTRFVDELVSRDSGWRIEEVVSSMAVLRRTA